MRRFRDRRDAGRRLADRLRPLSGPDVVVLGLPRGGVPVAYEVATALGAPLDVLLVRKLGVPTQPELAFGAIGEGGVRILNDTVVRAARLTAEQMATVEHREQAVLAERAAKYRGGRPRLDLTGRTAIIVDDGLATGATARAACRVARAQGAARVILAVPIGSPDTVARLRGDADEVVCVHTPTDYEAVGQGYEDFTQTTDREVLDLLHSAGSPW